MAFVASMMPRLEYSLVDVMVLYSLNLDLLERTKERDLQTATAARKCHPCTLWTCFAAVD